MLKPLAKWVGLRALKYAGLPLRDPALVALLGAPEVASGVQVDEYTALNASAVWHAVNLLSSTTAALPVQVFEVGPNDKRDYAPDHPIAERFNRSPNPEMTAFTFRQVLMAHALVWGNAYAQIEWNDTGSYPQALWPLLPNSVKPQRDQSGQIEYVVSNHTLPGAEPEILRPRDVVHIPGLGFDGLVGYSVIQKAREAIGLCSATERFGASFFGNGSNPGGVLTHPGELSETARKNLRESWERIHRGPNAAQRLAVLDEGMTWAQIGIPPEDAQFLQTRQFQIVEIARWFNTPPNMLFDLSAATIANNEQQGIFFLVYTLRPWLIRWNQEISRKLLSPVEQRRYLIGHDPKALLQTDIVTRYNAYSVARQGGWMSVNDILLEENRNPIGPDGDTYLQPVNMQPVGSPAQPSEKAPPDGFGTVKPADALRSFLDIVKGNSGLDSRACYMLLSELCPDFSTQLVQAIVRSLNRAGSM